MTFPVQLDDAGPDQGTIEYGSSVPARGIRLHILRPPPEPPIGMFLDEDGCGEFESKYNTGFKILWYPEATLPVDGDNTILVRAYTSPSDRDVRVRYPEAIHVNAFIEDDEMIQVDVPPADLGTVQASLQKNQLTNAIAVATNTISRLNGLGVSPLTGDHELDLVFVPNNNARQPGLATIELGPDSRNERYVIAHEIGHWVQRQAGYSLSSEFGAAWGFAYGYAPAVEGGACDFEVLLPPNPTQDEISDSNGHGMRSAEHNPAAMTEGFAHFVAAVAFNDATQSDGTFRYYKNIDTALVEDYQTFVDQGHRVSLEGGTLSSTLGGHSAWVEDELDCEDDWNHATFEISSGMDWMRFWWQFMTDASGSAPEFWDIVHLLAFADTHLDGGLPEYQWGNSGPVWGNLLGALEDASSGLSSHSSWYEDITPDHGVYNGE